MHQFTGEPPDTVESLRAVAVAADPTRPLLTWYDDATGERIELSGRTLDNWVAKTANLLVDGCGLGPGATAAVEVPPHWQTAAVLLGAWAAGLAVGPAASADVVFSAAPADPPAPDRYLLGLAPMGLPLREVPAGWLDYVAEVRGYGDRFAPATPVRPGDPALSDPAGVALTHAALVALARERAAALGIPAGARVLVDAAAHPEPVDWLLAPLSVGGSIVLCGHLDPGALDARVAAERVDAVV
jgi:uncharacterized protein (TIGR03089 family)